MKGKKHYLIGAVVAAAAILIPSLFFTTAMTVKTTKEKVVLPSIHDVPLEHWGRLGEKRIFFGHQSVGYNIIEGVQEIMREKPEIKLDLTETKQAGDFDSPIFAHAPVGKNTRPLSKIDAFEKIMNDGLGAKVDIAFFKFCYIDIMRDSDPAEIFRNYRSRAHKLKERFPDVRFVHITTPIHSAPIGLKRNLKQCVKTLLGKSGVVEDNAKRQEYNRLIRETYRDTEPVFDLALAESADPEGLRSYTDTNSGKVWFMPKEYTYDGGHLNEKGRKAVAMQLLVFLAELASEPNEKKCWIKTGPAKIAEY